MKTNIIPHEHSINQQDRSSIKSHKPAVLWFTGLSGSGKSTIANAVEFTLNKEYRAHTYLLDGDNIRKHLNKDLGFSASDRSENIRRIGEVCKLMVDAGLIVLTAFISPFREDRNQVREMLAENQFHEIYTSCPLELCEQRDPKGLYKKARKGEITQFTGISSPYEAPENPELTIHTDLNDVQQCMQKSIAYLKKSKII